LGKSVKRTNLKEQWNDLLASLGVFISSQGVALKKKVLLCFLGGQFKMHTSQGVFLWVLLKI
jgi:hypothetical protein